VKARHDQKRLVAERAAAKSRIATQLHRTNALYASIKGEIAPWLRGAGPPVDSPARRWRDMDAGPRPWRSGHRHRRRPRRRRVVHRRSTPGGRQRDAPSRRAVRLGRLELKRLRLFRSGRVRPPQVGEPAALPARSGTWASPVARRSPAGRPRLLRRLGHVGLYRRRPVHPRAAPRRREDLLAQRIPGTETRTSARRITG
jgi:hypothetical protein